VVHNDLEGILRLVLIILCPLSVLRWIDWKIKTYLCDTMHL
jgi:hypothetical protein